MYSTGAIPKGTVRAKQNISINLLQQNNDGVGSPLDKRTINFQTEGVTVQRPALHKDWIDIKTYIDFKSPPLHNDSGYHVPGELEAWLENCDFLKIDLENLLDTTHHKFWSQVVYDNALHPCLESYLSYCPRWYESLKLDDLVSSSLQCLHELVFHLFLRMATYKESKNFHITPEFWGNLIYDNFIFDMCKIMDLCVLYSNSNEVLLSKMIANIFKYQKNYYEDLKHMTNSLKSVLDNVEISLGVADIATPLTLNSNCRSPSISTIHDTTHYLQDTLYSIYSLIKIFPPASETLHNEGFDIRLALCYEKVIPLLTEDVTEMSQYAENRMWTTELQNRLKILRSVALSTFHLILTNICFLFSSSNEYNLQYSPEECSEKYLHTITNCIGERKFMYDLNCMFPLSKDISQLQSLGVDHMNLKFIEEAIDSVVEEMGELYETPLEKEQSPITEPPEASTVMNGHTDDVPVSDVEMDSLISSVQDLLPDLGAGFIEECLVHYNNSIETVISSILEDSLAEPLKDLDRSMTQEQLREKQAIPPTTLESRLLDSRSNVYDDDEFDVFKSKSVDKSRIHRGKRNGLKFSSDDQFSAKMKEIADRYDERKGTSIYEDELAYSQQALVDNYDDEYDDTYDDNLVADLDAKEPDQGLTIRGKGALNKPIEYSESEEETSVGNDDSNSNKDGRDRGNRTTFQPFCENPEIVRQRNEQRRIDRLKNRGRFPQSVPQQPAPQRSNDSSQGGERKNFQSGKKSGKSWRQGGTEEENQRRGGKVQQESSQHGKAQSKTHRHNMIHKNEHKRHGAQAKFNRNN